jgi:uncharacterized protein YnzC (UPF0291/DUF896 family)
MKVTTMRIFLLVIYMLPNLAHAEWITTKDNCSVFFPEIAKGLPEGRKSVWTGACPGGMANGKGALKVNAGTTFKSVFSGVMKDGQFDGLTKYHAEVSTDIKNSLMPIKQINATDDMSYFHKGVALTEDEYKERSTYRERYMSSSSSIESLEEFLISTARYDPDNLSQKVKYELFRRISEEHGIPIATIENEQNRFHDISDLETVFDIEEADSSVKRERAGMPMFLVASAGEVQYLKSKFRIKIKEDAPWKPRYGAYKVTVQFRITGSLNSHLKLLFIDQSAGTKEFTQNAPPQDFFIGSGNGWTDAKEIDFGSIVSNIGVSLGMSEAIRVQAKDIKVKYDILSISAI